MGSTRRVEVSTWRVMGSTRRVMGSTRRVMGSTRRVMGSTRRLAVPARPHSRDETCYTTFVRALLLASLLGLSIAAFAPTPAGAEPPTTHEILNERPSGFWTSNRPAINGAYRYRLLLIGLGVLGVTTYFVVRALRRASAERAAR
jgi:hypothetical protein